MPGLRLARLVVTACCLPGGALAQDFPDLGFPVAVEAPSPLLVVEQERLFAASRFGQRVSAEIDERSRLLAAENRQYEAGLEQEERDLTALRPTLEPAEFRERADAFNQRVQKIRQDQDAKARGLSAFRDSEQQRFLAALGPVLTGIAAERGAVAVLERRLVLVAADEIDITAEAVLRVDRLIGDGAPAAQAPQDVAPAPAPQAPEGAPAQPGAGQPNPPGEGAAPG